MKKETIKGKSFDLEVIMVPEGVKDEFKIGDILAFTEILLEKSVFIPDWKKLNKDTGKMEVFMKGIDVKKGDVVRYSLIDKEGKELNVFNFLHRLRPYDFYEVFKKITDIEKK